MRTNLFNRNFLIKSNKPPEISKDLNLNIKLGIQILSNALDMSKNTACVSFGGSQSKFEKVWWFIVRSWFRQELNERKPDWLGLNSSFSSLKREINISLSKIFPKFGKSETGR